MIPGTPPTAEGELAQTPFAHLMVFALDRRLTGELFLVDPDTGVQVVRLEQGTPTKIRVGDGFVRLGELLVADGLVTQDVVDGALGTGGLLGDVLVLSGYVDSGSLNRVLEKQFRARMNRLYALPPETSYKYFEGSSTLAEWGGEPAEIDPLELMWSGVREHGARSTLMSSTLELLGDAPLKLHMHAPIDRLGLNEDERTVIELVDLKPMPLQALLEVEAPAPEVVKNLVYLLAITRQLDLGKAGKPVGVTERNLSVARLRLKSQVHRAGAALDAPGDGGERSVRTMSIRGKAIIPREEDAPPSSPSGELAAADAPPSSADVPPAPAPAAEAAVEAAPPPVEEAAPRETPAAAEAVPASGDSILDEPSGGEESSRRLIADAVRGLTHEALLKLAREKIDEKDPTTAAEICVLGRTRLEAEGLMESREAAELVSVHAWARSCEPQPDLKALTVELDDIIRERDDLVLPRLVRGRIRRRLGNGPGALTDLRRVLEIDPTHAEARAEMESLEEPKLVRRGETGFFKRLFRR